MKYKLILGIIFLFLIFQVSAGETRNIEYSLKIDSVPYCVEETCTSVMVNVTNSTEQFNKTTCSSNCYNKITIEGVDGNNLFFEIDSGEEQWKVENTEFRYGYKTADLGNLSDITGIKKMLNNCTTSWNNLYKCQETLRTYDNNLTNCMNLVGQDNYSITNCILDKTDLENQISMKNQAVNTATKELDSSKDDKLIYGVIAFVLGMLVIWKGVPYWKGRGTPKDPMAKSHPPNAGY